MIYIVQLNPCRTYASKQATIKQHKNRNRKTNNKASVSVYEWMRKFNTFSVCLCKGEHPSYNSSTIFSCTNILYSMLIFFLLRLFAYHFMEQQIGWNVSTPFINAARRVWIWNEIFIFFIALIQMKRLYAAIHFNDVRCTRKMEIGCLSNFLSQTNFAQISKRNACE